jgi:hypothetical protein
MGKKPLKKQVCLKDQQGKKSNILRNDRDIMRSVFLLVSIKNEFFLAGYVFIFSGSEVHEGHVTAEILRLYQ